MANGSARELVKRLASTTTDSERSILRQVRAEGLHISDRAARAIVHRERPNRIGARRYTNAQATRIAVIASRPRTSVAKARDELEGLKRPIRATRRAITELRQMQRFSPVTGEYDYRQAAVQVPRPAREGAPLYRAHGVTRLANGDYAWVQSGFSAKPDRLTVENQWQGLARRMEGYSPQERRGMGNTLTLQQVQDLGFKLDPGSSRTILMERLV